MHMTELRLVLPKIKATPNSDRLSSLYLLQPVFYFSVMCGVGVGQIGVCFGGSIVLGLLRNDSILEYCPPSFAPHHSPVVIPTLSRAARPTY